MKKQNALKRNYIGYCLRRTTAAIIDIIIIFSILCSAAYYFRNSDFIVLYILTLIFLIFIISVFSEKFLKKTYGMWKMGLEIKTPASNKLKRLFLRKLINFLEYFIAPVYFFILLASKKKITFSEKYSKCFVVNSPSYYKIYKNFYSTLINQFLTAIYFILLLYIYIGILQILFILIMYIYGRFINFTF